MRLATGANACPFCGAGNRCGAQSEGPCWCLDLSVPPGLLELVPAAQKMRACICIDCIRAYAQDPEAFRAYRAAPSA